MQIHIIRKGSEDLCDCFPHPFHLVSLFFFFLYFLCCSLMMLICLLHLLLPALPLHPSCVQGSPNVTGGSIFLASHS